MTTNVDPTEVSGAENTNEAAATTPPTPPTGNFQNDEDEISTDDDGPGRGVPPVQDKK